MKHILLLVALSLAFYVKAQEKISFVDQHGRLQVQGSQITGANHSQPVQAMGMSFFWSQWNDGSVFYNKEVVKTLAQEWKCTILRTAMATDDGRGGGYIHNPTLEQGKVETVVDAAIEEGIYVIIDWHSHDAHNELQEAKKFFADMAQKYGDEPNVIYEIYNEPLQVSWSSIIKPYAEQIIDTIRAHDPDNLVIVGTHTWSQGVVDASLDPIVDNNVAYTLHYYAASHGQWLRDNAKTAMNNGAALVVTEYGTCDASGNGSVDPEESRIWWDFMKENNLSWCNWSVSNKNEAASSLLPGTSSDGNWTTNDLSESGILVYNELRGNYEPPTYTNNFKIELNTELGILGPDSVFTLDPVAYRADTLVHDSLVTYEYFLSGGGVVSEEGEVTLNGEEGNHRLIITATVFKDDTMITNLVQSIIVSNVQPKQDFYADSVNYLALTLDGKSYVNSLIYVPINMAEVVPESGDQVRIGGKMYTWRSSKEDSILARSNSEFTHVYAIYISSPVQRSATLSFEASGTGVMFLNGNQVNHGDEVLILKGENIVVLRHRGIDGVNGMSYKFEVGGDELDGLTSDTTTNSAYDCENVWAGEAVLDPECGCIKGTTGRPECPGPYNGTPALIPGRIEFEEFDKGGAGHAYFDKSTGNEGGDIRTDEDVDVALSNDDNTYAVGWVEEGEWLLYTVDVEQSGYYKVFARVASAFDNGQFTLSGSQGTLQSPVLTGTQGWANWETVEIGTILLTKGVNELKFTNVGNAYNYNYMDFEFESAATGVDQFAEWGIRAFPNPFTGSMILETSKTVEYTIYNTVGLAIEKGTCSNDCELGTDLNSDLYFLELKANGSKSMQKIVKQ